MMHGIKKIPIQVDHKMFISLRKMEIKITRKLNNESRSSATYTYAIHTYRDAIIITILAIIELCVMAYV